MLLKFIKFSVFLFLGSFCSGQMINDGALLTIREGTTVGVNTSFTNAGAIQNQGSIFLAGDWTNIGEYDSIGGLLIFNGIAEQEIINNGEEIDNLIIQNGVKVLNDDLSITGNLSLSNAILNVQDGAKLSLLGDAKIEGAGENAYINGKLFRSGEGDLFYPIGTANEYLPVTLKGVVGINPEVGLQAFDGVPSQPLSEGLESFANNRFWEMTNDESYGSSFIKLPFNDAEETDFIAVVQSRSITDPFVTIGQQNVSLDTTDGFVTSAGNAIGPYFSVAYTSPLAQLPPIKVVNVITPNGDGKHDFLRLENIELYANNVVEIFDRNGNNVFAINDYDNRDRVFIGVGNKNSRKLAEGNYFYVIKSGDRHIGSGFLFIKN